MRKIIVARVRYESHPTLRLYATEITRSKKGRLKNVKNPAKSLVRLSIPAEATINECIRDLSYATCLVVTPRTLNRHMKRVAVIRRDR